MEYLFNKKFKELQNCLTCGEYTKFHLIENKRKYVTNCGHSLFLTKDTIFYKSSTPLTMWFHAMFLFSVSKNGVSAKEIERQLGVTYKTAWRMANKIRTLMKTKNAVLSGVIEMDETYMGGIETNKHKGKKSLTGFVDKIPIVGMKTRVGGKVIANVESNTRKNTLMKNIYDHIGMNSLIITDELPAYKQIKEEGYWTHRKINHNKKEYVKVDTINDVNITISTNGIENFWSVFKRGVKGTYIRLSEKYMQSYVDEFTFRQSNKDKNLFKELIKRI